MLLPVQIISLIFILLLQVQYLGALGGHNLGDAVRRIMARLGSNTIWSLYSLRGRKEKKTFIEHPLCRVIISKYR